MSSWMTIIRPFTLLLLIIFYLSTIITTVLPAGYSHFRCPQRCQCYENPEAPHTMHLICKWDQLTVINVRAIERPDLVKTLSIKCPHFASKKSKLQTGMFQNLINLDRLEIERCLFEVLPDAVFAGLASLISLVIKNAGLVSIPENTFAYIPKLLTLDMPNNALKAEPYSLRQLHSLMHLDLSNNSIAYLTSTFAALSKLKVLTMDNNQLTTVDFRRFPDELTDLSLRHNDINTIHFFPGNVKNLRRLDLAGNNLDFIASSGFLNVLPNSLRLIDLSENHITSIQRGFVEAMSKLTMINLKNNSLIELREEHLRVMNGTKVKMLVAGNPFKCQCHLKWILHARHKDLPMIMDAEDVTCTHLIEENVKMLLSIADARNQLMCKYSNVCAEDCDCCGDELCSCRTACPKSCRCYRSADMEDTKTAENVIMCEELRLDRLTEIPPTVTELRVTDASWNKWDAANLKNLNELHTLRLFNMTMSMKEIETLNSLHHLKILELNGVGLTSIPDGFDHLSQLLISNNPLKELKEKDLRRVEQIRRVAFSGDSTLFECDCDMPSRLQRWMTEEKNRKRIIGLGEIFCDLRPHGRVRLIDTLPNGNLSLCPEDADREKWVSFTNNLRTKPTEISTTGENELEFNSTTVEKKATTIKSTKSLSTISTTTMQKTRRPKPTTITKELTTTIIHRKRQRNGENENPKIINFLIFVLFISVILLIIAILVTLYFRFFKADPYFFRRRRQIRQDDEARQPMSENV